MQRELYRVKKGLKKVKTGSFQSRLAKVLLHYRNQPQETTKLAPAELLLRRQPRTKLDLLKSNTTGRIKQKQQSQKARHDAKSKDRTLKSRDQVYVRNYLSGDKWLLGVFIERIASQLFKVHLDQLRKQDLTLTEPPADITSSTTPVQPEPPSELPIRDPPESPIRDPWELPI